MINLTLKRFKCWDNLTLSIPMNGVVLIKGISGSGKTTLFKAIEWVMYGTTKKITPHHTPSAKTSVTLQTDEFFVIRTKNPNHLIFKFNNIEYKEQSAQEKINQLYGSYDIWLSSVYVPQLSHNYFLITSNANRMEMLNQISFQNENPTEIIQKMNQIYEKHKTLLDVKLDLYHQHLKDFEPYDINLLDKHLSDDQVDVYNKRLDVLQVTFDNTSKVKKENDIARAIRQNKLAELQQYQSQLPDMHCMINHDLNQCMTILDQLKKLNQYKHIDHHMSLSVSLSDTDYNDAVKNEIQYNYNDKILSVLSLPHDQNIIDQYILNHQHILDCQDYLNLHQELKQLEVVPEYQKNPNIDHLRAQILQAHVNLENLKNVKTCPHCHQSILIQNNQLIKSDVIVDYDMDIDDIKTKEQTLRHMQRIDDQHCQSYHIYKSTHDRLINKLQHLTSCDVTSWDGNVPLLSKSDKQKMIQSIEQLKTITIVSLPLIPSTMMKQILEKQKLLSIIPIEYQTLNVEQFERYIFIKHHIDTLTHDMNHIKIDDDNFDIQLANIKCDMDIINNQLSVHQKAKEVNEKYNILSREREELIELTNKVNQLEKLKTHAVQLECHMLENVIHTMNNNMEQICQTLFVHDIRIDLNLVITKKPQVHFSILYKGGQYDSITELSGGEADRTSLSLTMALHCLSSYPLIMFDESLKSLDPELKHAVIKTLKEYIHSTVLIIDHDGLESIVDHIINVELL